MIGSLLKKALWLIFVGSVIVALTRGVNLNNGQDVVAWLNTKGWEFRNFVVKVGNELPLPKANGTTGGSGDTAAGADAGADAGPGTGE